MKVFTNSLQLFGSYWWGGRLQKQNLFLFHLKVFKINKTNKVYSTNKNVRRKS